MAQSLVHQPPLHIGTADEFARVRSALQGAGFDEETICRTLKIEEMCDVGSINLHEVDFSNVPEQFQLFVRLFFVLRLVPRNDQSEVFVARICCAPFPNWTKYMPSEERYQRRSALPSPSKSASRFRLPKDRTDRRC